MTTGKSDTKGVSMKPVPQDDANGKTSADMTLWAILSAGFFIRCAWLLLYPEVIENEGAVYASLAENLFAGKGYIWPFGGRYILFPPLYPILIGTVSFVTGAAADTASRIVSLGMGALLPIPVFLVTKTLFNRPAAVAASALVAFHPMLIVLSGSGYSESIYFTNWFFGIHFAIRTLERETTKHAALSGAVLRNGVSRAPGSLGVYPSGCDLGPVPGGIQEIRDAKRHAASRDGDIGHGNPGGALFGVAVRQRRKIPHRGEIAHYKNAFQPDDGGEKLLRGGTQSRTGRGA